MLLREERSEPKSERLEVQAGAGDERPAPASQGKMSELWLAGPFCILAFAAGAALARLFPALRWESLPIVAAGIAAATFAFVLNRIVVRAATTPPPQALEAIGEGLKALLDSTGPAVVAMDLEGQLIYCNPAVERLI